MSIGKLLGASLKKQEDPQIGKVELRKGTEELTKKVEEAANKRMSEAGSKKANELIKAVHKLADCDNQIDVKIKCTNGAKVPFYEHEGDSGFDFICLDKTRVYPNQTVLVQTGISMEIPQGYELQIRPRSGLSLRTKLRVANSPGTIDSTYRGEIGIIITNHGKDKVIIHKDEKFAQGVLCPVYQAKFERVEELTQTTRGARGFGSTD